MPVSEAQKKSRDKWDRENMTTLGCKVKKEDAAAFRAFAKEQGKTTNTVLKEYVQECIKHSEQG